MRGIRLSSLLAALVPLGALGGGACEPVPTGDSHFWPARPMAADSGTGPVNPHPDAADPEPEDAALPPMATGGSTGSGGSMETGGTTGSGGSMGTGGATGSGGVGGMTGTGGMTGLGGRTGSGGNTVTGGTTGSGGRIASGGTPGTGGVTGAGGGSGVLTGTLKVTVTTKAIGGQYSPRNCGAIWIADSGTKFVKSLYVWAERRRSYLSRWTTATSAAGLASNVVDAVTAATLTSHGTRTATWNGTNTNKALVPDGAYKVCFELSEGTSQYQCVDFNKGRTAQNLTPADTTAFAGRTIGYTP